MSNALYAILAMALVTSVGAGVAIHVMESESPENLVTVEGTVSAVDWNPHFNESVELTLTTANGTNSSFRIPSTSAFLRSTRASPDSRSTRSVSRPSLCLVRTSFGITIWPLLDTFTTCTGL